jgi:hypothetical protein
LIEVAAIHPASADAEDFDDVTPLPFRDTAPFAVPEELAQHCVLGTLDEKRLPGRSHLHSPTAGELDLVVGRRPDGKEVHLHDDRQVEDVAAAAVQEGISKHVDVDLEVLSERRDEFADPAERQSSTTSTSFVARGSP